MTAVVETFRKVTTSSDLKIIVIQGDATTDTGFTIDLGSDTFAGSALEEILLTLVQDDAGQDEEATWDPATGIITLGTMTATGIHNIMIVGY